VVVGVDPAVTSGNGSAETGIIVVGKDARGDGYVLADYSVRASPEVWARKAVAAFHAHLADKIVAEANNGGDLVTTVIRTADALVPVKKVHAARGKATRAGPVSMLYEQRWVHHATSSASSRIRWSVGCPARETRRIASTRWYGRLASSWCGGRCQRGPR
jgi:phage terminase large subunit-like protein